MGNFNYESRELRGSLLLSQFISGINIWIEELRQYAQEIEGCLTKKIRKYEYSIKSEEDIIEKQQLEMFRELYRSSLFITCYAFFEFELSIICNSLFSQFHLGVKLENYKRGERISFFGKMMEYLVNICNLSLLTKSEYVQTIITYNRLRNNIIHNAGRLVQNYDELKKFIDDNKPEINLNDYDLIILSNNFAFGAITTFESFFEEFFEAFSSWTNSPEK